MNLPATVYAMRHEPTGKIYVGSSAKPKKRIQAHLTKLQGGYHENEAMQKDVTQYGAEFSFFELGTIRKITDRRLEYNFMDILKTRDPEKGYNTNEKAKRFCLDKCKRISL